MEVSVTRHITSDTPRVMVVDGSKVVRKIIDHLLHNDLPGVTVLSCSTGEEAKAQLATGVVDLVTTALRLPDMDGLELARYVREHSPQAYIPIVVVSGDVNQRLESRDLSSDVVTDYFDKSLGPEALSTFIRGYVRPEGQITGEVLYVEDSRVVAVATRRMMEKHGLKVNHVVSVEDAIDILDRAKAEGRLGADIILTDVYLKGGMTGGDLLEVVRGRFGYGKGTMPILVMTGDDNAANQTALLRAGANDLVQKPTEERLLITKLGFQLRVAKAIRAQAQA
ncbi:MAG: response regulator [Lysobacterales bacterium]